MQKNAKSSLKDVIVVGFAMFAIFFGAGNLIFPPYLGMVSGQEWFKGFLCFMIADAGLAVMTVLAMIRYDGTVWSMLRRLSKPAAAVMATVAMLCVGPLLCIPRTCATTFEMGVLPLFPECSPWLFGALFFGAVFILTVRPSAVIDIIGKFLTPALLLTLAVLFVKGVIHPIGTISTAAPAVNVAQEGLLAGYQTMDVFGALAITLVVVNTVKEKGYSEEKLRFSVISKSSIVAALGLFFVYCALSFLGATSSELELGAVNQAGLVVTITELLLQRFGVVLLAVIVLFACLTTAIGLTSSSAEFFSRLTKNKISYPVMVGIVCAVGLVISTVGISTMIDFASPILNIIYPIILTQIILSFFNEKIANDNVYRGAAIGAFIVCTLDVIAGFGVELPFLQYLPLDSVKLSWMLPATVWWLMARPTTLCGCRRHCLPAPRAARCMCPPAVTAPPSSALAKTARIFRAKPNKLVDNFTNKSI